MKPDVRATGILVAVVLAVTSGASPGGNGAPPLADGFDYPVGSPDAVGYYDAQPFGENAHLGEDWNGVSGGDSDLGDPIHAVAAGRVVHAEHAGPGWGLILRIVHRYRDGSDERIVESFYAHLDAMYVDVGDLVERGQTIGTIGNADGKYIAHLHFELRFDPDLPHGPGYAHAAPLDHFEARGWTAPTRFIDRHRPPALTSAIAPRGERR